MKTSELLELAAKAAGIPIVPCTCGNPRWPFKHHEAKSGKRGHWNPLEDDGDALRLMVQQGLEICRGHDAIRGEFVEVFYRPRKYAWQKSCIEYHKDNSDQVAATRRAIVRAASSIGGKL